MVSLHDGHNKKKKNQKALMSKMKEGWWGVGCGGESGGGGE